MLRSAYHSHPPSLQLTLQPFHILHFNPKCLLPVVITSASEQVHIDPKNRNAIVTPSKTGDGIVVRWVLPPASSPLSRCKSKRLPLLIICQNLPAEIPDLYGPQSPLAPLRGEGLPALPPSSVNKCLSTIATQRSLSTLPTLTDTSNGGSRDFRDYRTPTPHRAFNDNSALHTPRKKRHPRSLVRSSAIGGSTPFWRQCLSGIAEADIGYNANGEVGRFITQEEADQASSRGGDSEYGDTNIDGEREYTPPDRERAMVQIYRMLNASRRSLSPSTMRIPQWVTTACSIHHLESPQTTSTLSSPSKEKNRTTQLCFFQTTISYTSTSAHVCLCKTSSLHLNTLSWPNTPGSFSYSLSWMCATLRNN